MTALPWLILWIPFFAAAFIFFFTVKSPKLSGWIATGGIFTSFVLSVVLFLQRSGIQEPLESSVIWMAMGVPIEFGVLVNGLSFLMIFIATGIGTLIFLYSTSYMEHEAGYSRYFASLSLFAFSMLGIVLSNNLIQVFIFWELVGLSSYLLIGFYFEKPEAAIAGKKAFITTRVGDVGMMIGILMLFGYMASQNAATFNFLQIEHSLPQTPIPAAALTAISLLIFMGVMGKSAQMPLHVWLPDAMEGPTPVSALIHAATMVAAGVFLLARFNFVFITSETALMVIAWTGGITALLSGTIAFAQQDIKKILAYSTLSQLGYMVMALGLKNVEAGMFHLTTHAFFKALLFLGSGSLIHAMHTQNIWEMPQEKSLLKSMPITSITFLIGTFALMGVPPLSGYFSKEEILAAALTGPKPLFILSLIVVFCTAFYMGRLCTIVFFRTNPKNHGHAHESNWKMALPLLILAVLSVIGGYLPIKAMVASHHPGAAHAAHHGGTWLAILSIGLALAGFALSYVFYIKKKSEAEEFKGALAPVKEVLLKKYYFDDFYDKVVIAGIQENIAKFSDLFEKAVVVESAVNGTAKFTRFLGDSLRRLQTGAIQFYAFVFTAGLTLIIFFMIVGSK
jgi:NADH-quinone oxidoreductase subunit L